jgi:threonine/homoserine/homoserine lactone efflux protein
MEFVLIAAAHFLALVSPGPDFFLITQASLRLPLRCSIAICGGIAAANAGYLLIAVFGLEAMREITGVMIALRYLGAGYLVFLGVMLLRSPMRSLNGPDQTHNVLQSRNMVRQFLFGFAAGILNPKNAIFYLSLFTVMVSEQTGVPTRCLYALWMTAVVFLWDCGLVLVIGQEKVKSRLGRGVYMIEKIAGVMLTLFGLMLPFS